MSRVDPQIRVGYVTAAPNRTGRALPKDLQRTFRELCPIRAFSALIEDPIDGIYFPYKWCKQLELYVEGMAYA